MASSEYTETSEGDFDDDYDDYDVVGTAYLCFTDSDMSSVSYWELFLIIFTSFCSTYWTTCQYAISF